MTMARPIESSSWRRGPNVALLCYNYEVQLDAVISFADGTDLHTPLTAIVFAIDGVEAVKVWIEQAPAVLTLEMNRHVVSVRPEHVHSARVMWGRPEFSHIWD